LLPPSPPPAARLCRALSRSGFTLVELLAVIVIIGVLAGILISVISRVRISARTAQCKSNMRQLSVGLRLFLADNRDIMPYHSITKDENGESLANWIGWYSLPQLGQYFTMPWAPDVRGNVKRRVPWCPEIERDANINGTYAATGYCYNSNFNGKRIPSDLSPSRTVVFYEDIQKQPGYNGGNGNWYGASFSSRALYKFAFRHNNTGHLLFLDGHVATFRPGGTDSSYTDYPDYTWKF
ncbi:MAG: prepilin-type N-terminal cleavage/methylation domain-containing protein, partial [Opitutaceae bacterium]|nr:prepilin-type N-terminal cleavage/methylation domain-containing protein [Opitutaceae bacterium]